jgi:hypothetical protein
LPGDQTRRWHRDSEGTGGLRYWTGNSWSDETPADAGAPAISRSGRELSILIGLGVMVVVVLGAVVAGVTLAISTDAVRAEVPPAAIGEEVRDGDFAFVVTGVRRVEAVVNPDRPDIEKAAQGEFVIVEMTVTNIAPEPQTYSGSFNTLSDGSTVYRSDDEAWLYFGKLPPRLNPGESTETSVVFDVPEGIEVALIELHDEPTTTGVTVDL